MEFISHTNSWVKGEIFEAIIIGVFGLSLVISSISFWVFGNTPNAKSVIIPLMIVGIIFVSSGISMYLSNQKRLLEYP